MTCWCVGGLLAQESRPAARSVGVTRLANGVRLAIDGRLTEPEWATASELGALTQVDPVEGSDPAHPTRVRLCYNRDFLYIALECMDVREEVRGRLMARDANLDPDDRVEIWIDTFNDKRFAYWFQIGAAGSRGDALIGGGGFNKSWDGIWYGRSRITPAGWQAEVAIPFKTIAFREGAETWGFNLRRFRKANDEEDRWARPRIAYSFFTIANGGTLTGLRGMRQGVGLDVIPYVKGGLTRNREVRRHASRTGDSGLDLNYRWTPSLNFRLTYNTDFAETEVDQRQTNLTRFPLFFPEKRDFFLEDSGLFTFAGQSRSGTLPFFSRRIGRDAAGGAVPIILGGKLTGRVEDWNVGVLSVYQDDHADTQGIESDRRALSVMRVSRNLGRASSVGVIATSGRPTGSGESYTAGVDFLYRGVDALGRGKSVSLRGWWVGSFNDGPGGDDGAYGIDASYDSKEWDLSFNSDHVEEEFSPQLGFVRRRGVRTHRIRANHTWRSGGFVRRIETALAPRLVTTERGRKDSWDVVFEPLEVTFATNDSLRYNVRRQFWRLDEGFEIEDGVLIPAGDYTYTRHSASLRTSERRWAYADFSASWGEFYSGDLLTFEIEPTFILGRYAQFGFGYQQNRVELPTGAFTTHLWSGRADFSFTPELTWRNLLQYDSDSKNLSVQSRFRWIFRPGRELFLVGVYGWQKADHDAPFIPTSQDTALKVLYTFRF